MRTFYDPKLSSKGAVLAASRAPRTITTDFMQASCVENRRVAWHPCSNVELGLFGSLDKRTQQLRLCCLPLQLSAPKIYNPNALPLYREDLPGRPLPKKRRKEVEDEKHKYTPSGGSMAKGTSACCRASSLVEFSVCCGRH